MNKKGFTLIELMIVIAIIGIMVEIFTLPISFFMKRSVLNGKLLEEKRSQATVFYCMKHFLKDSTLVKSVSPTTVNFADNRKIEIVIGKRKILFFDGKHTKTVHYDKSIKFSPLKKVDYMTFGCFMTLGRTNLPMFWRSGK